MTLTGSYAVAGANTYSYHGDDFSYDYNYRHNIKVCDEESDGNKVKGSWVRTNGSGEVTDGDGDNGVCATASVGSERISKHHTCEKNYFSWDCDNWQTTS